MENKKLKFRTGLVIIVTVITMIAEIFYGFITHSMALTADGFHMGTHAFALTVTFIICLVIDRYKDKEERLNALGGYSSAVLLGITAIGIIIEAVERFFNPLKISFTEAIFVTVIGLAVNLICIFIMKEDHHHDEHEHNKHSHENMNFKAAYIHILADALTSIMAIAALLLGKYFNMVWLDPVIGIIGGAVILKWAVNLLHTSFRKLVFE